MLPTQGAWVQSPVRELRSHILQSTPKTPCVCTRRLGAAVNQAKAKPRELPTSRRAALSRSQPPHLSLTGTGSPIQADVPPDAPSFIPSPPRLRNYRMAFVWRKRHSAKSLQKASKNTEVIQHDNNRTKASRAEGASRETTQCEE